MSLVTALTIQPDTEFCNFTACLMKKSEMVRYEKNGQPREYFVTTVACETVCAQIRIYQKKLLGSLKVGKTYSFSKMVRKSGACDFWCLISSTVYQTKSIVVPPEICERAQHLDDQETDNVSRTLEQALTATSTSSVKGVVVKVSPLKRRRNGELLLRHVALRDIPDGKAVKLALWNTEAEGQYKEGDCLELSDVYGWTSPKKHRSLGLKKTGKLQFLPVETFAEVPLDFDAQGDSDFDDQPDEVPSTDFTILGFQKTTIYTCCKKIGCQNKKLVDDKCPHCTEADVGQYCYAQAVIQRGDSTSQYTIFQADLEKLFHVQLSEVATSDNLMDILCEYVPKDAQGIFQDKKLSIKHQQ